MSAPRETLAAPAEAMLEVKKSRHLARAEPVDSPQAALAFIERVSVPEATHNGWAYRIGAAYRFSDDGEPAGTAGKPILAAIDGQGLDGVAVVVTRWFGTGGKGGIDIHPCEARNYGHSVGGDRCDTNQSTKSGGCPF